MEELDKIISGIVGNGMKDAKIKIEYGYGFEFRSTCYETWCGGWSIEGEGVTITGKRLEAVVIKWVNAVNKIKQGEG